MKYKISKLAEIYNMTTKGIHYYEEKGILNPSINENNKYRNFHQDDASDLYQSRKYHKLGFSLENILDLMNTEDLNLILNYYENRKLEIEEQFYSLLFLGTYVEKQIELIEKIKNNIPSFTIKDCPEFYRLSVFDSTDIVRSSESINKSKIGAERLPFTSGSMLFNIKDYNLNSDTIKTNIGYIYYSSEIEPLKLNENNLKHIHPQKCVYGIVYDDAKKLDTRSRLDGAISYIKENNLNIKGEIFTREIIYIKDSNKTYRYDELWIPLCDY